MCLWGVGFLNDPQWYSHLHNLLPQGFGRSCEYNHSFNYITLYGQGELFTVGLILSCEPFKKNRLLDSVGEGEGGMFWENSIETSILSRVKQTTSPGWIHETSTRAWCTGKTQRVGIEREAGVGIGMGNTYKSMADSCQCMAKTTTIL